MSLLIMIKLKVKYVCYQMAGELEEHWRFIDASVEVSHERRQE